MYVLYNCIRIADDYRVKRSCIEDCLRGGWRDVLREIIHGSGFKSVWLHQPGSSLHWNWRCPKMTICQDAWGPWLAIEWDFLFSSLSLVLREPQRNFQSHLQHKHLCGMYACLVSSARAIMQNLFCSFKIIVCLFAVLASPQSHFFVHRSFSMLVDDKPNGGSEGRAYLFHKTTSNLFCFKNNVKLFYLKISFLL